MGLNHARHQRTALEVVDGVSGGHHSISHHGNNPQQVAMYQKINTFHVQMFAKLLKRMSGNVDFRARHAIRALEQVIADDKCH